MNKILVLCASLSCVGIVSAMEVAVKRATAHVTKLSRLEILEKRKELINQFMKLRTLDSLKEFIKTHARDFDSPKDLINARSPLLDNTLMHDLLQQIEPVEETEDMVLFLAAAGGSMDSENLMALTARELCAPRFEKLMKAFPYKKGIQREKSPMREATEASSDGEIMNLLERYKSPLDQAIEAAKARSQ